MFNALDEPFELNAIIMLFVFTLINCVDDLIEFALEYSRDDIVKVLWPVFEVMGGFGFHDWFVV